MVHCFKSQKSITSHCKIMQYGRTNINTKEFWDASYSSGAYQDTERERHQILINQVVDLIEPKSTVLDVGCGTGWLIETLRDQKQCDCVGIDISEVSINIIEKMGIRGYMTELPNLPEELQENRFDYITILETLEHLSKPEKTLRALLRLSKPDGRRHAFFSVRVPNADGKVVRYTEIAANGDGPDEYHPAM